MLIIRLFSVVSLILISGCAASPEKPIVSEEIKTENKQVEASVKVQQKEIKTAIAPDVLYMLLAAELAGQRGQYEIALEGYMEAAKRVNDPRFAERAASIAMYMKNSGKTDEALSLWLSQDPNSMMARKLAALSALRSGDKRLAVEHINALLASDSAEFENALLELVGVLQKNDKAAFVYDVLETVSAANPSQASVYFVQSLLAMQMNNKDVAEKKVQQALNIKPDWDSAIILQSQIALASGNLNKTKQLLTDAANKYPENDKIKKLLAQFLVKTGDYEEAGEIYQSVIKANPKDADAQFELALLSLQVGRDKKAEDILSGLLNQAGWRDRASLYLGKIEESRGNTKKALSWFDKVTDGSIAFESAMSAVALLAKSKQFDEASLRLDLLARQYPKQKLRIILMQAGLYSQQSQYEKAFELLSRALAEQPEQKDLLYTRALMADRIDKRDVLESDLLKILKQNPDDAEALNALGYSLLDDSSRYGEAEKYLQHALKLHPHEAVIIDSYGWLQFKRGNLQQALMYLEQAYSKQQEGEIAAHLCEVLWALGRKDEAINIFTKAIKIQPEDEYLLNFKKRILNGAQ